MGQIEQAAVNRPYLYHLALWILSACSFATGIGFAYAHHLILLFAGLAILPAGFALTGSKKITCLLPLLFFVGYISLVCQRTQHAHIIAQIENKTLNIEAEIESIEPVQHALYRYLIVAHVHKTHDTQHGMPIDVSWRLQCYTNISPSFEIGDTVAFAPITVRRIGKNSFYDYLVKEQIHATVFLKTKNYRLIKHPHFHLQRTLHVYKHAILKRLRSKCPRTAFTLFTSVFLGNRNYVKQDYQDIKERFHHWGIMHFLARSGLHLVMFILLLQLLLQLIPVPLLTKHLLTLAVTAIYAALSWQSISFARACATFGWYKLCHIAGLQINVTHIVLLLSCLFLLVNPSLLFFLDFQLSFGLTLILSLTNQLGIAKK